MTEILPRTFMFLPNLMPMQENNRRLAEGYIFCLSVEGRRYSFGKSLFIIVILWIYKSPPCGQWVQKRITGYKPSVTFRVNYKKERDNLSEGFIIS